MTIAEPPFQPGDRVKYSERALLRMATWPGKENKKFIVTKVYAPDRYSCQWAFSSEGKIGMALCRDFQKA